MSKQESEDEMTHTPGPWSLEGAESFGYGIRDGSASPPIADNVRGLENARLIAAAPALLEALEALTKWLDDSDLSATKAGGVGAFSYGRTEYSVVSDARAAIALARGEALSETQAIEARLDSLKR